MGNLSGNMGGWDEFPSDPDDNWTNREGNIGHLPENRPGSGHGDCLVFFVLILVLASFGGICSLIVALIF